MLNSETYIEINLVWNGMPTRVRVRPSEFHSLMGLISSKLAIPGFGICNGMGSCGTCYVRIDDEQGRGEMRLLSCAVPVNELLHRKLLSIEGKGR